MPPSPSFAAYHMPKRINAKISNLQIAQAMNVFMKSVRDGEFVELLIWRTIRLTRYSLEYYIFHFYELINVRNGILTSIGLHVLKWYYFLLLCALLFVGYYFAESCTFYFGAKGKYYKLKSMPPTFDDVCFAIALDFPLQTNCYVIQAVGEIKKRVKESKELFFEEKKKDIDILKKYDVFIFEKGEGWIKWEGKRRVGENCNILVSLRGG